MEIAEFREKAQSTLSELESVLRGPLPSQSGFMVTILRRADDGFEPLGIEVNRIDSGCVYGSLIQNSLTRVTCGGTSVERREVVDWRFVDTFEMLGGYLYKHLWQEAPARVKLDISSALPFIVERESVPELSELRLYRAIANHKLDEVRDLANGRDSGREALMPVLTYDLGRKVDVRSFTVGQYAALYGNSAVMDILFGIGCIDMDDDFLLLNAAFSGNANVIERLVDQGFDPRIPAVEDLYPLNQSVMWGHLGAAEVLLKRGADANCRDHGGRTPLFFARSSEMAAMLMRYGAKGNVVDDSGSTCVSSHIEHSRRDVAAFIANALGSSVPHPSSAANQDAEAVVSVLNQRSLNVTWGYVLPVPRLALS